MATTSSAFAHARYDRSEPPTGAMLDGQPFVLKAYFTQELTSKSTLRVLDANGVQVDLGDGQRRPGRPGPQDDVRVPAGAAAGRLHVEYTAESAEDGHAEPGTFAFGVGMAPPSAGDPAYQPAGSSIPLAVENADAMVLDAY